MKYIDVGTNGRISDGQVWNKSRCARLLESGVLNLPNPEVGNSTMILPYVFVVDDASALKLYFLKPYVHSAAGRLRMWKVEREYLEVRGMTSPLLPGILAQR